MFLAIRLKVFKHFLPKGCRPVIERGKSNAEQILIITFFHFPVPEGLSKKLKGIRTNSLFQKNCLGPIVTRYRKSTALQ